MAAAEQILELFESYWFETTVLRDKSPSSSIQNTFPQRRQRVADNTSFIIDQTMATTNVSFREGGNRKTVREQPGHKVRARLELEVKELKGRWEEEEDERVVCRPYLSEAYGLFQRKGK
ncbi:hypothetical protein K1719_038859 [Acacia pycnantha]|nr:hypothetical protein K1719_038859 [Acacia pycnantha]